LILISLSYHVPSETGSSDAGDCQFIWVWYEKIEEDSEEFREIFIDTSGKKYLTTIPRGKMQPSVWAKKRSCGTAALTKPFAELLEKTTDPFVSAIRESAASKAVFYGGKLILVGDAFALIRPHTGSSTNQAARQALGLADVFKGSSDLSEWEKSSIEHAESTSAFSLSYAEYCFTGNVPSGLPIKPDNQAK
jgi:2-polyprenyl-6-methoxyphenol hydroxylase-like FAD-dependent oxidoreductase